MVGLKVWAAQLVAIILLGNMIELLIPFGTTKRYVRMTLGLLILLGILNPILGLISSPNELAEQVAANWNRKHEALEPVENRVVELQRAAEEAAAEVFKRRLEREVRRQALEVPGVKGVQARVELKRDPSTVPTLRSVDLTLIPDGKSSPSLEGTVRRQLGQSFGLAEKDIWVRWARY